MDVIKNAPYIEAIRALARLPLQPGFEQDFVIGLADKIVQFHERTRFSERQRTKIRELAQKYLGDAYVAEMLGQMRMEGMD